MLLRFEQSVNSAEDPLPILFFGGQLGAASFGEGVVFGAAAVFGFAPLAFDPTVLFQAVERGERDPGLTMNTPRVICLMRSEAPRPCMGPSWRARRISMSRVPCRSSDDLAMVISTVCRKYIPASYRTSIGMAMRKPQRGKSKKLVYLTSQKLAPRVTLFVPQGDHRVYFGGAAGWEEARQECYGGQDRGYSDEGDEIGE